MLREFLKTVPDPPIARPIREWHEDMGPVIWFRTNDVGDIIDEPGWIGSPLDDAWPQLTSGDDYYNVWIPHPPMPVMPT